PTHHNRRGLHMTTVQGLTWRKSTISRRYLIEGGGRYHDPVPVQGYLSSCGTWGIQKADCRFRPFCLIHQPSGGIFLDNFQRLKDAKACAEFIDCRADWNFADLSEESSDRQRAIRDVWSDWKRHRATISV